MKSLHQLVPLARARLRALPLLAPDYPFAPRRVPFFYGWAIAIATTIGILASIPGQTVGVSVFTDPLLTATGLSRLALSNAYLVGTLASGLLLPLGGMLIDRWGARLVAILACLGLAATLVYLSASDRLAVAGAQLLGLSNAKPLGVLLLILGFISLRFSGQGMLTLVSRNVLGKWFDRRRGFVSGLSGIFVSFGFSAAPLLLSVWVQAFGWRQAWLALALAVGLGMSSLSWLFYRDNPEECGLVMDGKPLPARRVASETAGQPREFTRPEALATLLFWAVTLALASQALAITGITFHIVDIGTAAGLPETQAVAIFLPIAAISTLTGYAIGVAADRVNLKGLFLLMMVFEAVGVASIADLDIPLLRGLAIIGLGISGGCFGTLTAVALPHYFGRRHLGAISGVQMMSMVMASALGPSLLASFEAVLDSYRWGLYVSALLPVGIFCLVLAARSPQTSGDRLTGS